MRSIDESPKVKYTYLFSIKCTTPREKNTSKSCFVVENQNKTTMYQKCINFARRGYT